MPLGTWPNKLVRAKREFRFYSTTFRTLCTRFTKGTGDEFVCKTARLCSLPLPILHKCRSFPSIEIGKRNESDPGIVAVLEIGNFAFLETSLSGRMSVQDLNKVLAFSRGFIMNFFLFFFFLSFLFSFFLLELNALFKWKSNLVQQRKLHVNFKQKKKTRASFRDKLDFLE